MHHSLLLTCVFAAALAGSLHRLSAAELPAVAFWNFDGDLVDRSGRGNDAFAAAPSFAPGRGAQGLQCDGKGVIVPDSPDLRPAPGLRIDCWVRLDSIGPSWQELLLKEGAYQLRVDPPKEGGRFSFFLDVGGWEPRVTSTVAPMTGVWHHLRAGWDGEEIWIEMDGQRSRRPRSGNPTVSGEPLELGRITGTLDEVRIENPGARFSGAAQWLLEGTLDDSSGHGFHLQGKDARFVPVPGGQALRSGSAPFQVASRPELQLAPGFRIDCSVFFEQEPTEGRIIAMKDGEYQLRVDPAKEGGYFAFFTKLDSWEPRVNSAEPVKAGQWYRVSARWDGFTLTLDVNGVRRSVTRSGLPKVTDNPLLIGGLHGMINHVRIENPRLPTLQVRDARQEHAILCAGRPEKLTTAIRNVGMASERVVVRFDLPPGVRSLTNPVHDLGPMPAGTNKSIEWAVQADAPSIGRATIQVNAEGAPPVTAWHPLIFFGSEDSLPSAASDTLQASRAAPSGAKTFHIDSTAGSNANSGASPETAWKDFTNINGRTLGPGERLLIRRGSVIHQELTVSARGTEDNWAEIGAYGSGPRPILRRNWDIDDRCALIVNPDHLRIGSLVVCYAGKGLIVHYTESGHRGLLIEDCIAHHIEGLYRHNSHGIPGWLDRRGAEGDSMRTSAGIGISGAPATGLVFRDSEVFQNSSGFFMQGEDLLIDRVYCHDNIVHNTSPHPFLVNVRRAVLQNSVFDASGWHASAGTMGIMLGSTDGLVIRGCYFRNQPDSGSHDQGGIDFENRGNGCLIDRCTFENNAGAAVEVLGLKSPQTTNIEIRNSRFIKNNTANKLGPSEIFIWGRVRDPAVCCSTGTVHGNGYLTLPGVEFFINEAPDLTSWTLRDNTRYPSVEEIDRAMPFNRPPVVSAGPDIRTNGPRGRLSGKVSDDGKPAGKPLRISWEVIEGPGRVEFADAEAPETVAGFDAPGDYLLRLLADDGELWISDMVEAHILPPGVTTVAAWEFNTNLDKEGWTEVNPGTRLRHWPDPDFPTKSEPIQYVTGGHYILAIEDSPDAHLLSPGNLDLPLTGREKVVLRFQNLTPTKQMRLRFTTEADGVWDDAKSLVFVVQPDDTSARTYSLDLSTVPGWKGALRQLRLDLAGGTPLTGTCRIDYLQITTGALQTTPLRGAATSGG